MNNKGNFQSGRVRTFEIVQYVTGPLEGKLEDWPASIQDAVYQALERKAEEVELPLMVVDSACGIDYGEANDGSQDRFFLHILASEIVVRDTGFEQRMIEQSMKKLH